MTNARFTEITNGTDESHPCCMFAGMRYHAISTHAFRPTTFRAHWQVLNGLAKVTKRAIALSKMWNSVRIESGGTVHDRYRIPSVGYMLQSLNQFHDRFCVPGRMRYLRRKEWEDSYTLSLLPTDFLLVSWSPFFLNHCTTRLAYVKHNPTTKSSKTRTPKV